MPRLTKMEHETRIPCLETLPHASRRFRSMYFSIATPARVFSLTIPFTYLSPLSPRFCRITRGTPARLPPAPFCPLPLDTKSPHEGGLHQPVAYHADSSTLLRPSAKGVRRNTRMRWAVSAYFFLALAGTVYATCPALSDPAGGGISYSNVS